MRAQLLVMVVVLVSLPRSGSVLRLSRPLMTLCHDTPLMTTSLYASTLLFADVVCLF